MVQSCGKPAAALGGSVPAFCTHACGPLRPPAFLDEEADEAVSVEDKVGALGVAVADDRHQPAQLARARQHMELRVRRGEVRLSRRAPDTTRPRCQRTGIRGCRFPSLAPPRPAHHAAHARLAFQVARFLGRFQVVFHEEVGRRATLVVHPTLRALVVHHRKSRRIHLVFGSFSTKKLEQSVVHPVER